MRFGRLGRFFQSKFDLLLFAQQIAPVAFFIPVAAVQLDGMLDTFATVAALQIVLFAVFVAPPADNVLLPSYRRYLTSFGWVYNACKLRPRQRFCVVFPTKTAGFVQPSPPADARKSAQYFEQKHGVSGVLPT